MRRHRASAEYFIDQMRLAARPLLQDTQEDGSLTNDIIFTTAILGGFTKLISEKLILLDGVTADSPNVDLSIPERRKQK